MQLPIIPNSCRFFYYLCCKFKIDNKFPSLSLPKILKFHLYGTHLIMLPWKRRCLCRCSYLLYPYLARLLYGSWAWTLPSPLPSPFALITDWLTDSRWFRFSTFNWTVPFCSYLVCVAFTLGTVVLYLVPLKFLLLAFGKNAGVNALHAGFHSFFKFAFGVIVDSVIHSYDQPLHYVCTKHARKELGDVFCSVYVLCYLTFVIIRDNQETVLVLFCF